MKRRDRVTLVFHFHFKYENVRQNSPLEKTEEEKRKSNDIFQPWKHIYACIRNEMNFYIHETKRKICIKQSWVSGILFVHITTFSQTLIVGKKRFFPWIFHLLVLHKKSLFFPCTFNLVCQKLLILCSLGLVLGLPWTAGCDGDEAM